MPTLRVSASPAENPRSATIWDYQPCIARRCMIVVGDDKRYPEFWARPFVGKKRQAVEVLTASGKLFLDNEDGSGMLKLTENPDGNFRELPAKAVIGYLE